MKNLIIIGARAGGRSIFWLVKKRCNLTNLYIKGFLDDNFHALEGFSGDFPPILSSVEEYSVQEDDVFFCALGNPDDRMKYVNIIKQKGGHFFTIICEKAIVSPNVEIGEGSLICDNSIVGDNVSIGNHTIIAPFSTLGHDIIVGDYVYIEPYCLLGGYITIGNNSIIHNNSSIIAHTTIGKNASIGMGSIVFRDINDNEHVLGNPAKEIPLL